MLPEPWCGAKLSLLSVSSGVGVGGWTREEAPCQRGGTPLGSAREREEGAPRAFERFSREPRAGGGGTPGARYRSDRAAAQGVTDGGSAPPPGGTQGAPRGRGPPSAFPTPSASRWPASPGAQRPTGDSPAPCSRALREVVAPLRTPPTPPPPPTPAPGWPRRAAARARSPAPSGPS